MRRAIAVLAAAGAGLLLAAPAQASVTYQSSFGGSGTGAGQLSDPSGVAVNYTSGDVYVADRALNRVSQFDSAGVFIRMWGKGVDQTTGGDVCTAASGHTCQAGGAEGSAGAFVNPQGIGVDNSTGPAAGSVYVQDAGNNRVQRFDADGQFVLTWGKGVDQSTGGDLCTAASGDTCKAGGASGSFSPPVTSATGEFAGWDSQAPINVLFRLPNLAVDGAGAVYVGDPQAFPYPRVQKFDPSGAFLAQIASPGDGDDPLSNGRHFDGDGIDNGIALAVDAPGDAYVLEESVVKGFDSADFTPSGRDAAFDRVFDPIHAGTTTNPDFHNTQPYAVAVDPHNQFLFVLDRYWDDCGTGPTSNRILEFHPAGQQVDCTVAGSPVIAAPDARAMAISTSHRLYLTDTGQDKVHVFATPVATLPAVSEQSAEEVTATTALVKSQVAGNLDQTTYHVEYGTTGPCSTDPCASTDEFAGIGASTTPLPADAHLSGLDPATTYHYRVVATNDEGTVPGADRSFTTYPAPVFDPNCPNNLARQQTGSALLLDCRAYELVSAEDQGGYNVTSDLIAGQTPYSGYPQAKDKVLYAVHNGGIPGTGKPTNRGPDPYVASRDQANQRWNTSYVGIPADAPSDAPFSSTLLGADPGLSNFAFGPAASICAPCFDDGSVGIPLHRPDGALVQGMVGSIPVAAPVPAATLRKPFSGDGAHFLFGSKQLFETAGNSNGTDATIYERDLEAGTTEVVSTDETGATIANGNGVAELDVSTDGSRIVIGKLISTDAAANPYYHLYLHLGQDPNAIDLTPGATNGVLYDGMTSTGGIVYFSAKDALATATDPDTDASADLYRAEVDGAGALTLTRVSSGEAGTGDTNACNPSANSARAHWNAVGAAANCDAVAIGGGGGVASGEGSVYFLSPERLDTSDPQNLPVQDHPNLYIARPGQPPRFIATLESNLNFGSYSKATGVAVDHPSGDVYVLDISNAAKVVKKFDPAGNPVAFSAGSGAGTNQLGGADAPCVGFAFSPLGGLPTQLAVDQSSGNFYVPDTSHGKLDVFSSAGDCLAQITVATPAGVAVNPTDHNVYVPTGTGGSSTVKVFTPAGAPAAPVSSFSVSAQSPAPKGVAVDSAGTLYVVNNVQTAVYSPAGAFVKVLDPNPSFGVAVDSSDNVFVNEGARFVRYDSSGAALGDPLGVGTLTGSVGIAVDDGGVYASNKTGTAVAHFDSELKPKVAHDSPLVIDSLSAAGARRSAEFQTNPSGDQAVFPSTLALSGFNSADHTELFRYDAPSGGGPACVSCSPIGAQPSSDAGLASDGLSLTDDGRVFFTSGEPLALRDSDSIKDAYEWAAGRIELISAGTSSFDSGLLSASADGTDAFFFTRDTLASGDSNGSLMKIYDARAGGGFFDVPPPPLCAASDECHGPGSAIPGPPAIGTGAGGGGNVAAEPAPKPCRKGTVRRHGRCVKHPHKPRHHKRAGAKRGGGR